MTTPTITATQIRQTIRIQVGAQPAVHIGIAAATGRATRHQAAAQIAQHQAGGCPHTAATIRQAIIHAIQAG